MSGTLVGVVDCLHTSAAVAGAADRQQNVFVNLYDFMQRNVTAGNAALHASNFGSGGTGFDYHDGANPAGENAWAVFRFLASASSLRTTDFYVLIQWAESSAFGASPGNPGTVEDTTGDGIAIIMAYREAGGDPWNGTTVADGTDTKGTPVWAGAGLHVLTRRNETGTRSTNKEDLTLVMDISNAASVRFHAAGDADGMWIGRDGGFGTSDDGDLEQVLYLGVYTPRSDLVVPNPYVFCDDLLPMLVATQYISSGNDSGHMGIDESRGVVGQRIHNFNNFIVGLHRPEDLGNGPEYMDLPIFISRQQSEDAVEYGLLGHLLSDIVRLTYGMADGSANAAFDRAYIGNTGVAADHRLSLAWGGGAGPNIAGNRDGSVF